MKQFFDLPKIMKRYNLDIDTIAPVLYPNVRYTKVALERVLKGEAYLDTVQIIALAEHLGILVGDLFTVSEDGWRPKTDKETGALVFEKEDFVAKLNYNNTSLTIFKGGKEVYHELVLVNNMPVTEFTEYINKIIVKFN